MDLVLLPGLDGTGLLFPPFRRELGGGYRITTVAYPTDRILGYDALSVPLERPSVLIAESFSGPLAIRAAAARPDLVKALVLVATFAKSPVPVPAALAGLVSNLMRLRPPRAAIRAFMLDFGSPPELVETVAEVIGRVRPEVLSHRLAEVFAIDVERELARLEQPILYVRASRDRLIPGEIVARRIAKVAKRVAFETIDGPHLVLQARPTECARVIVPFLHGLTAS